MGNVERNIMDSVGHGAAHHPTKTHRKEDGRGEEKAETKGKEKVKERKGNVSTKSQNHQKSSGQVDLGNYGQNNLGMLKQTLQRQLSNFNMRLSVICDSRMWVLPNT